MLLRLVVGNVSSDEDTWVEDVEHVEGFGEWIGVLFEIDTTVQLATW